MRLGFCNEISRQKLVCSSCHNDRFIASNEARENDLAECTCGLVIGPLGALQAFIGREAFTPVNAILVHY
jgi:hypothetical protein